MVGDLRKAGIASGDFKNLPQDLLASLFIAPIMFLLKAELKGRKWTDAELDAAAKGAQRLIADEEGAIFDIVCHLDATLNSLRSAILAVSRYIEQAS